MDTDIYFIMESEDYDDKYGFAFSPEGVSPKQIQNWKQSEEWSIISLELKGGDYADYLVNDLDIPLCSPKMKNIIENKSSLNKDDLLFYPVNISYNNSSHIYYFFKPPELKDVIDMTKSITKNNTIFRPYFIAEKIEDIFRCDYDTSYLFVTEKLMKSFEKENITGIDFYTWLPNSPNTKSPIPKTPEELLIEERIKRGKMLGGHILLDAY
jgi:hypothetical protein